MEGGDSMSYVAPVMYSFSKEDIRNNIVASATCNNAVCNTGAAFSCDADVNYVSRDFGAII